MRLTTKGRYAITAVLDLALHHRQGPVSLRDISRRQDIPESYLGQLFVLLRQKGLVSSRRGPGGGYMLAKPSASITMTDIIDAVGEQLDAVRCGGKSNCQNNERCLTHSLWEELGNRIRATLTDISLDEVAHNPNILEVAQRQDRQYANFADPNGGNTNTLRSY